MGIGALRLRTILTVLVVLLLLAGCERNRAGEQVGTVIGAVGGALLGAQLGDGAVGILGAAAGGVLGGILGRELGKEIDAADAENIEDAGDQALEAPVGTEVAWNTPETGNSGTVKTTKETRNAVGRPCREIRQDANIDGEAVSDTVVACKQEDGTWALQ